MKFCEALFNRGGVSRGLGICGLFLSLAGISVANAQIVTLVDNNSVAQIDTSSPAGMFYWGIQNGPASTRNILNQQWFWYRVGETAEAPINAISAPSILTPNARSMTATYTGTGFAVRVDYVLTGGSPSSGVSDIGETITIYNTSASTMAFHLFQYSDFNLSPGNDTVQLGVNLRGRFNEADQNPNGPNPDSLSETVVTPGANHGEAALVRVTLGKLNDGSPTVLSDALTAGPGDATWAFQWDLNIAAGGSAIISKDKYAQVGMVPEPSVAAFIGIGFALCLVRQRLKK